MPYLNVDLDYFDHRKTKRLIGLLGRGAEVLPIRLWAYCGKHHCETGRLAGYCEQEIESLAGWWGKPGAMLEAMKSTEFMGQDDRGWYMHDWENHQGHLAAFSVRGKAAATARWAKYRQIPKENATSIPKALLQAMPQKEVRIGRLGSSEEELRKHVGMLTDDACAYCGTTEKQAGLPHQQEHFHPRCLGGAGADNLLLACAVCNGAKQGRVFDSVADCKAWLHWRFWSSTRRRYESHRRTAFGGTPPSSEVLARGLELNGCTAAQPSNSKLLGTSLRARAEDDLAQCQLKDLPEHLNTPRMQKQWQVWMNVRRGYRNKPKHWAVMFNNQIEMLEKLSEPDAYESLSASIRNGWQGLFPPKNYGPGHTGRNNAENPRNFGVVRGPTDHAAAVQRSIEREAKKAEAKRLAEEMATAQYDPPADHGSGGSGL